MIDDVINKAACKDNSIISHRSKICEDLRQNHDGFDYFCHDSRRDQCPYYESVNHASYCVADKYLKKDINLSKKR